MKKQRAEFIPPQSVSVTSVVVQDGRLTEAGKQALRLMFKHSPLDTVLFIKNIKNEKSIQDS